MEGSLVAVGANETVVPASELQEAMRCIKQLEGALGVKTLENEIPKEAADFAKANKQIVRSPPLPRTSSKGGVYGTWHISQQRIEQEDPLN